MAQVQTSRSGVEQAAILLLTLGEQDAAQVLKHLGAKDVQLVGAAMAQLTGISRDEVSAVLGHFAERVERETSFGVDSDEYVRNVLTEALGSEKAGGLIDRILRGRSNRGLEAVKWMEPTAIAEMLGQEHPQIVAIVLSYLEPEQGAEVLAALPESKRADVVLRIATLDGVHPSALQELDEILERQFTVNTTKAVRFGGPKAAADLLNRVGGGAEMPIIEQVSQLDASLGQRLQDLMFVFEDLTSMDDRGIQELLREVPGDQLIISLKATGEELKQKVFKNMSERAAQMLRDDLEAKGPVKLREVEAAQKEILATARRMADEGRIQLGGKGSDEYV
jgi:flagellar motor switch protein FliG